MSQLDVHCFDLSHSCQSSAAAVSSLSAFCDRWVETEVNPASDHHDLVVVGAPSLLTTLLKSTEQSIAKGDTTATKRCLGDVLNFQVHVIQNSLGKSAAEDEIKKFVADLSAIQDLTKLQQPISADTLVVFASVWTARLVAAKLRELRFSASMVNLQGVIQARSGGQLDLAKSPGVLVQTIRKAAVTVVPAIVLGPRKQPTSIEPNQLAGWLSRTLRACSLKVWVDSGLQTANPSLVKGAEKIKHLDALEARELAKLRHPSLPHWQHIDSETELHICGLHGGVATSIHEANSTSSSGVKAVHHIDEVHVLSVDATDSNDITAFSKQVEDLLAAARIYPLATDFDQEFYRVAFTPEVAQHAKTVLRAKGIGKTTIEIGYSLVAIVGSGLDEDWLLSFEFQKVFRGTVKMLDRTDHREIAVIEKTDPREFLAEIHENLVTTATTTARAV